MNGRRRFLLGTVLSVQNGGFIYPACQNCCSRLILTSCRYECHKCGCTYNDATHRYKLCVKVSEENRLHVITVFGKCLEKIFGASADSLHGHLQVSTQLSGDLGQDGAQGLFFQAAERCLIGRSFVFAVKPPGNFDRRNCLSNSNLQGNMVACQIILLHEDPAICTVLSCFNQLVASVLSAGSGLTKSDVSSDTWSRDVSDGSCSESSPGLLRSRNHYADYWQQSLGLVSSPVGSTLDESQCSNYRQGDCSRAEQAPNTTQYVKEELKSTEVISRSSSSADISPASVKCSFPEHTITRIPQTSAHFYSFFSKSEMAPGQESQKVCEPGSRRSQSCSALSSQLPPQTAETHQATEEIWEDFPFSESLSEFIAKIEDEDANESKTINENFLGMWTTQNDTVMIKAPRRHFHKSITCTFTHGRKVTNTDDNALADQTFPSTVRSRFQESFENSVLCDPLSRNTTQNRRDPIYLKTLSSRTFSDGGCSSVGYVDKFRMSLVKETTSYRRCVEKPKSSDVDIPKVSIEVGESYDASADLFEASNTPEDGGIFLKSPNRRLPLCITDSPCTEVLPYRHKDSRISVCSWSENDKTWNNMTTGDFIPNLQSTPVVRRLSEASRLPIGSWRFNAPSSSKSSTFSLRTKSTGTIGHILLNNTKRRKSAFFLELLESGSLWSPGLSPFSHFEGSTVLIARNRRRILAPEPQKSATFTERKENSENQERGGNDDWTVERTDHKKNRREESMKHGEGLDHIENRSPVNHEDLLHPWSPELFSEKSDISCLQRRLF